MEKVLSMCFYREATNRLYNGKGAGDDALPFMGKSLISVADGAGAKGSARQKDINPLLLDKSSSFEAATAGLISLDDPHYAGYKQQYLENFFNDGFDLSRDYPTISEGRKSSYFGSRLASIFVRLNLDRRFAAEDLADYMLKLNGMDKAGRGQEMKRLGRQLASKLFVQMAAAAKNCGLVQGTTGNLNLMATTYSGILFVQGDGYLDTITIQAGDSLPYAFVMDQGRLVCRLLAKAQERADGGMYNLISADKEFSLECSYRRLETPCAIMCATDGCFDASCFPTDAHFEHFMLDRLRREMQTAGEQQTVLVSAQEELKRFFSSGVSSDDSSTMAFKAFGFEADTRIKMLERCNELKTAMELENLQLYSEDSLPEAQLRRLEIEFDQTLLRHAEEFWGESPWIRAQFGLTNETPEARRQRLAERAQLEEELKQANEQLQDLAYDAILAFWQNNSPEANEKREGLFGRILKPLWKTLLNERAVSDLPDSEEDDEYARLERELIAKLSHLRWYVVAREGKGDLRAYIKRTCSEIDEIESRLKALSQKRCSNFEDLVWLYSLVLSGVYHAPRPEENEEEYALQFCKALKAEGLSFDSISAKDTASRIADLADELLQLDLAKQDLLSFENSRGVRLADLAGSIRTKKQRYQELEEESPAQRRIREQTAKRDYLDRPLRYLKECYSSHSEALSPAFVEDLKAELRPLEAQIAKYQALASHKAKLIEDYNRQFLSFVSEEV